MSEEKVLTERKYHALKRAGIAALSLRHVALKDWSAMGAWVQDAARLAVVEHALRTARERAFDAHDEPGRVQP